MAMNSAYLDLIANSGKAAVTHIGLKDSGDTELSGGDPAYARLAVTWGTTTDGDFSATNVPLEFDVPAGANVARIAYYSAATGGTEYGADVVTQENYAAQGVYRVTAASIAHDAG